MPHDGSVYGRGPGRVNWRIAAKRFSGACPIVIPTRHDDDLQSLRQENARLQELVVQLSSLVIKTRSDAGII